MHLRPLWVVSGRRLEHARLFCRCSRLVVPRLRDHGRYLKQEHKAAGEPEERGSDGQPRLLGKYRDSDTGRQ